MDKRKLITLTIPGCFAQKRHRTSGKNRYDPSSSDKKIIRQYLLQVKPSKPLEGKFGLKIVSYKEIPKSWSNVKRKRHEGTYRAVKPDFDNHAKIIGDVMNEYIIKDDAMIVWAVIEKRWSTEPRTEIELHQL